MKMFYRIRCFESLMFLLLMLGVVAFAHAQDDEQPKKKVKVEIEITENGKTSTTTQELELNEESINGQLEEMVEEIEMILEESVRDIEETDLEIVIRRNSMGVDSRPHYRHHISAFPDWSTDHLESEPHAFLGVVTSGLDEDETASLSIDEGVRIIKVVEHTGAERAGLKNGDIILEIDGEPMGDHGEVSSAIRSNEPGDEIDILVLRNGEQFELTAELTEQRRSNFNFDFEWEDDFTGRHQYHGQAPRPPRPPHPPHPAHKAHRSSHSDLSDRKVFLGIQGKSMEDENGVVIQKVYDESTASEMGLEEGDQVYQLDEEEVDDINDLVEYLKEKEPGEELKVKYIRDGKKEKVSGVLKPFDHEMKFEKNHAAKSYKYVYHVEVETLEEDEVRDFNKRSGESLDETNSLELDHFNVSPNPSNGVFVIDLGLEYKGEVNIQVFDFNGRKVYEKNLDGDADLFLERVDLTEEEAGVYIVSVTQNGQGKVHRIVKH